jgi:hypothetical protein
MARSKQKRANEVVGVASNNTPTCSICNKPNDILVSQPDEIVINNKRYRPKINNTRQDVCISCLEVTLKMQKTQIDFKNLKLEQEKMVNENLHTSFTTKN